MKNLRAALLLCLILCTCSAARAQIARRHKIAVFIPLYLDSAFNRSLDYEYGKTFPKFLSPGLEFYEGVQLAADSLTHTNAAFDINIYDTRSSTGAVNSVIHSPDFDNVELIIGQVNREELIQLSEVAKQKNIPFIDTNLPNNYGVTDNPSLVLLSSTLRTHVEAIFRFLQKGYSTAPIVVFSRKGEADEKIKAIFADVQKSSVSIFLKPKFVTLNPNLSPQQIIPYLDSTRMTMCVAGSLDEGFAKQLSMNLAYLNKSYPVQLMGMPTWDAIRDFDKKDYAGLEIYYSTPFYNARTDKASAYIANYFKSSLYSRPTDMAFRGYECLMRFSRMLLDNANGMSAAIGEKKYKVFTDFDIQPVLNHGTMTIDYYENRKLYFIRMVDGSIKGAF